MLISWIILFATTSMLCVTGCVQGQEEGGQSYRRDSLGVESNIGSDSTRCGDHITLVGSSDFVQERSEEQIDIPGSSFELAMNGNIGVVVQNGQSSIATVRFCKLAAGDSSQAARAILDTRHLSFSKGIISVAELTGAPRQFAGVVLLLIPKDIRLTVSTHNGGIALLHTNDTITASSLNGGITVKDGGGNVTVNSQNGGLRLVMAATWNGKGLEAHTVNGGVMMFVPSDYVIPSELRLATIGPRSCKAYLCTSPDVAITSQSIRVGVGSARVEVSSDHGQVTLRNRVPSA